jgi:hypothetical protein
MLNKLAAIALSFGILSVTIPVKAGEYSPIAQNDAELAFLNSATERLSNNPELPRDWREGIAIGKINGQILDIGRMYCSMRRSGVTERQVLTHIVKSIMQQPRFHSELMTLATVSTAHAQVEICPETRDLN